MRYLTLTGLPTSLGKLSHPELSVFHGHLLPVQIHVAFIIPPSAIHGPSFAIHHEPRRIHVGGLMQNRIRTSPNHALQRTATVCHSLCFCVRRAIRFGLAFLRSTVGHRLRQPSAVAELGVVRRRLAFLKWRMEIVCAIIGN